MFLVRKLFRRMTAIHKDKWFIETTALKKNETCGEQAHNTQTQRVQCSTNRTH